MNSATIHDSGAGADRLKVNSWGNGWAYAFYFGEAGSPMLTRWFQDQDATTLRAEFDKLEEARPDVPTRDLWLEVLDPYL